MPEYLRWYLLGINTGFVLLMAPVAISVLLMRYWQGKDRRD
jgi:hypothetical protein